MKAIISSTYDNQYLFFIPIVIWCWNKLGVDVICFMPECKDKDREFEEMSKMTWQKTRLISKVCADNNFKKSVYLFDCPKDKEATYAQCSRLYAATIKNLSEDEMLMTSDVDMALLRIPEYDNQYGAMFSVFGSDLVPSQQYPMCYLTAKVKDWRKAFNLNESTYQEKLDELLGHIETEHFRGNYWGKDQEEAFKNIVVQDFICQIPRTNGQNQFATKRYDRDDAYLLHRLSLDTYDYHLPRPGYEEGNFNQIMTVLKWHYPTDSFDWLIEYRNKYVELL